LLYRTATITYLTRKIVLVPRFLGKEPWRLWHMRSQPYQHPGMIYAVLALYTIIVNNWNGTDKRNPNTLPQLPTVGTILSTAQTEIAQFWAAGTGTVTPPGMWVQIATSLLKLSSKTTHEKLSIYRSLCVALANAVRMECF
jgi:hypothetical protein